MWKQNIFQMKEPDNTPEKDLNEMQLSNLPDKEFNVMVIKILTELGEWMNIERTSTKRKYKKISKRTHKWEENNN